MYALVAQRLESACRRAGKLRLIANGSLVERLAAIRAENERRQKPWYSAMGVPLARCAWSNHRNQVYLQTISKAPVLSGSTRTSLHSRSSSPRSTQVWVILRSSIPGRKEFICETNVPSQRYSGVVLANLNKLWKGLSTAGLPTQFSNFVTPHIRSCVPCATDKNAGARNGLPVLEAFPLLVGNHSDGSRRRSSNRLPHRQPLFKRELRRKSDSTSQQQ